MRSKSRFMILILRETLENRCDTQPRRRQGSLPTCVRRAQAAPEIPLLPQSLLQVLGSVVSGDRLAKAIVLRRDGGYILAVLPASHRLRMPELKAKLGDDIDMASEHEVNQLFADCARGAVPAAGACYGLDV